MSQASRGPRRRQGEPYLELQLLSARAAALQLGVNQRTAQKRAARALIAGDTTVQVIAGAYVAPLSWWQRLMLSTPIRPGPPLLETEEPWFWECMTGATDAEVH